MSNQNIKCRKRVVASALRIPRNDYWHTESERWYGEFFVEPETVDQQIAVLQKNLREWDIELTENIEFLSVLFLAANTTETAALRRAAQGALRKLAPQRVAPIMWERMDFLMTIDTEGTACINELGLLCGWQPYGLEVLRVNLPRVLAYFDRALTLLDFSDDSPSREQDFGKAAKIFRSIAILAKFAEDSVLFHRCATLIKNILLEGHNTLSCRLACGICLPEILLVIELDPEELYKTHVADFLSNPLAHVCFIAGMINITKLEAEDSNSLLFYGELLADLSRLASLEEFHKSPPFALTVSRTIVQWAEKAIVSEDIAWKLLRNHGENLLDMAGFHAEHFVDAVQHQGRALMKIVFDAMGASPDGIYAPFLDATFAGFLREPHHWKRKYAPLTIIAKHVTVSPLMNRGMIKDMYEILKEKSMLPYVQDFVREVGKVHLAESPRNWADVWLEPFFEVFVQGNAPIIENLVPDLLQLYPPLVDEVLARCSVMPLNLLALKLLPLDRLIDQNSILEQAQWSTDEKMRLALLNAMTNCSKSREPLNPRVIPHLKVFLRLNCSTQSQALRQNMFSSFKKLIHRMHDSDGTYWDKPGKVHPVYGENLKSVLQQQKDFVSWMFDFCVGELRPGCNFFTRSTILMLLELLSPFVTSKWTQSSAATLLQCIKDTYESNKTAVMKILANIDSSLLPYLGAEKASAEMEETPDNESSGQGLEPTSPNDWIRQCVLLTRSARPPDCVTAAYMLRIISAKYNAGSRLAIIKIMRNELAHQIQIAEEDGLVEASSASPMYGALTCLRTLLDDVLQDPIPDELVPEYQEIFQTLIQQCASIAKIAGPLVTNASPEGQLRIDEHPELETQFKEALFKGFGKNLSKADTVKACAVASQMLLLCCWRSHKEVSLTFGVIATHLNRLTDQDILPVSEFMNMGTFFMDELSTVRHRGAFEQAYVGFSSLCWALWRSPVPELNHYPPSLLRRLLEMISAGTVSSTRRSAGLPFIVQALVIAEPEINNGSILKYAMQTLLTFAESETSEVTRVHALNVLKALFKDTRLGETIMAYVSRGLQTALEGFDHPVWGVRNSCTLLFAALITRIFGVNRSKQDIERKNCLTGQMFFLRFPELYNFLYERMVRLFSTPSSHPGLVPILLLFGRLLPSIEETKLDRFIYVIDACTASPIITVRKAAAKAFAMILPTAKQGLLFRRKLEIFTDHEKEGLTPNDVHGYLLQVQAVLDLPAYSEDFKRVATETLRACSWFLEKRCSVVAELYVELLMRLGIRLSNFVEIHPAGFSIVGYTNLQRVVAQYKCELGIITLDDVVSDHQKRGVLEWSLKNKTVLPEIMLGIIRNPDAEHPDVQELAFDLAARDLHSVARDQLESFMEAFVKQLPAVRIPTVAVSMFSCMAQQIPWVPVNSAISTVEVLKQYSAPNQDPKMRTVASDLARTLLETWGEDIFFHAHMRGVYLDLCEGLINLVVDNDSYVRNQVVIGLSSMTTEDLKAKTPLDSILALCSDMCASEKEALARFLVQFALATEEAPLDVEVDEQPFEKSELNTFHDSLVIAESCRRAVTSLGVTKIDFDDTQLESLKARVAEANACDLAFNRQLDGDLVKLGQHFSVLAMRAGRLDFLDRESCPVSNVYFNQFKRNLENDGPPSGT